MLDLKYRGFVSLFITVDTKMNFLKFKILIYEVAECETILFSHVKYYFSYFTDFKSQRLLNMNILVMQSSLYLFITRAMAVRHQKVLTDIF